MWDGMGINSETNRQVDQINTVHISIPEVLKSEKFWKPKDFVPFSLQYAHHL